MTVGRSVHVSWQTNSSRFSLIVDATAHVGSIGSVGLPMAAGNVWHNDRLIKPEPRAGRLWLDHISAARHTIEVQQATLWPQAETN